MYSPVNRISIPIFPYFLKNSVFSYLPFGTIVGLTCSVSMYNTSSISPKTMTVGSFSSSALRSHIYCTRFIQRGKSVRIGCNINMLRGHSQYLFSEFLTNRKTYHD